jgi:diguanylate cyclase (GGDEF)-like protein
VNFQSQLEAKLHEAEDNRKIIALLFIDVDDFKEINDSRGHDVGDRALRMIADRLSRAVSAATREFDHLHLARVGGDEFTIVVGNLENNEQAARLAEDLLKRIAEPIVVEEQLFNISGSIGIAVYPQDGETASSLLNNADAAMYRSKNLGKGTYRFYEPDMNNELFRSSVVKAEFKAALASPDQLELRYQPLVNLFSGEVVGAEALIRWHHPRLGLLPPDEFIAIVEHNEIALPTDLWVLERALDLLQKLDFSAFPEFAMSINISASNLVRKQFTSSIQKIINDKAHIVHRVKLEITETFLHTDERQALEALQALRQMGFGVWLDDFGTGYSSLNHLKTFPVEGIKIDQSFISNLAGSANDRRMVSALLGLAHAFSVHVIAEGIDNQQSLEFLRTQGCRIGQGMMLGKPMSDQDLINFISAGDRRYRPGTSS